ncbi:hypothetical protein ACR71X_11350 [Klebsiella oxytoca]
MTSETYSLVDTALKYALWPFLLILIVVLFRKQIKEFLNTLNSAKKVKLGVDGFSFETNTDNPIINNEVNDENGKLDPPPIIKEKEIEKTYWYLSVNDLLKDNKIQEAKTEFETFVREHKDTINYDAEYAFFSYLLYQTTKDENILDDLLLNIKQSKEPNIKKEYVNSYIYCLNLTLQYTKAISFLKKIISETDDLKINSAYIISLSKIYLSSLDINKGESEIIKLIRTLSNDDIEKFEDELFLAYLQLAEIEKTKDDKINYALCLDKALEFKPSNESTLFSAAYESSQLNFLDSLAISNYSHLENLAPKNDAVINNLGVAANKLELKIIACDYYRKAKDLNSSISYSNIGYKLLEAGCAKEAEELARVAITFANPDKNNYELLAKIKKDTEEEYVKWQKHKTKSNEKQKFIRNYVGRKYNSPNQFPTNELWIDEKERQVKIAITEKSIAITWQDPIKDIKFYGSISNTTLKGIYISSPLQSQTLLGSGDKTITAHCVGYYDEKLSQIIISATESDSDLKIILKKNDNV